MEYLTTADPSLLGGLEDETPHIPNQANLEAGDDYWLEDFDWRNELLQTVSKSVTESKGVCAAVKLMANTDLSLLGRLQDRESADSPINSHTITTLGRNLITSGCHFL